MTPVLALLLANPPFGVWRVEQFDQLQEDLAVSFGRSTLIVNGLTPADKGRMMDQLAEAFQLPEWFGRNWDALNDSLADLTRRDEWPDLVVIDPRPDVDGGGERNLATLADVLTDVAQASGRWFLIVGSTPTSVPMLQATGPSLEST